MQMSFKNGVPWAKVGSSLFYCEEALEAQGLSETQKSRTGP